MLAGEPSNVEEFFQAVYITDVWKDAAFKEKLKRGTPCYGRYWRSKLEIEISSTATERVICVGRHARCSAYRYIPPGVAVHSLDFPGQWLKKDAFKAQVQQLAAEMYDRPK